MGGVQGSARLPLPKRRRPHRSLTVERTSLLRSSPRLASYWTLEVDGQVIENSAWSYSAALPPEGERLADYMAFDWEAMDAWCEEEERVIGHPRDPYDYVDTRESSRNVQVVLHKETVADTHHPRAVFETGLPTRYYIPPEDAQLDLLTSSETQTLCAYKGEASYRSAMVGEEVYEDIAWSYPDPLPDNPQIQNLICFFNEQADI